MSWMLNNSSLQRASEIINKLESSKFPLLLNRITQAMQQGLGKTNTFTASEREKLQTSLVLDENDLTLLLDSISLIFEKAACHMTKPQALQLQLVDSLGLSADKASSLATAWASAARAIVDRLRNRSVFSTLLEDAQWSLNLQTASSVHGREKIPVAILQFALKCDGNAVVSSENLNVEFNHEELYQFYNQLEKIQAQLDSLR